MPDNRLIQLILIALTFFLFEPLTLFADEIIHAVSVEVPPKIDGRVTETAWSDAAKVDRFIQQEPDTGEPASQKTEFYVCYDRDNLYVAAKCYDDPELITALQLERDASLKDDDKIVIILDTFLDRRNAFWFQMNARGCKGDALLGQNGAALNKDWDGLWEGRASIHAQGWDMEAAIPFKTLNFHPNQDTWGIKFLREIQRRTEKSYWPVANINSYKFQVSDAGLLTGLESISQGIGLDLRPYLLMGGDKENGASHRFLSDGGLDVFYQITPGLKSAVTINTDFAQTEVDDRQINLTRFPLFFPEKRDFFLDGASYFQFGREGDRENEYANRLILFFSRRIGLDNQRNPIPIIGGSKITGQVGLWNIGLMDVVDDRDQGVKNFAVARISRNFGSQSRIGIIGTSGNSVTNARNTVFGADLKMATSTFQGDKNLSILLYGLKSNTGDASGDDLAFGGEVNYPNDFFSFRSGYSQIEKNFHAGLGFVPRKGIRNSYVQAGLGPRPHRWGILQFQFQSALDLITDLDNRQLSRGFSLVPLSIQFQAGDLFSFQVEDGYERLIEEESITDIAIPAGNYHFRRNSLLFSTAHRRPLWIDLQYDWGGFYNGSRRTTTIESGYKIAVPLFVGLALDYTDGELSTLSFTREVYRLKVYFLFSPRVTLNNFIQYDNHTERMGWQSRFRWILKPGNEINLVWSSISQDPFDRFEITEMAARLKLQYNYRF